MHRSLRAVAPCCLLLTLMGCAAPAEDESDESLGAASASTRDVEAFTAKEGGTAAGLRATLRFTNARGGREVELGLTRGEVSKKLRCTNHTFNVGGLWKDGKGEWSIECDSPGKTETDFCFTWLTLRESEPARLAPGQMWVSCYNAKGLSASQRSYLEFFAGAPVEAVPDRLSSPTGEKARVENVTMNNDRVGSDPDKDVTAFFLHVASAVRPLLGTVPTKQQNAPVKSSHPIRYVLLFPTENLATMRVFGKLDGSTDDEVVAHGVALLEGGKARNRNDLTTNLLAAFGAQGGR